MPKRLIIGGLLATSLLYSPVCAEDAAATNTFNEEKALSLNQIDRHGDTIRWGGANGLAVVNLAGKSVIVSDGTHQLSISFNVLKEANEDLVQRAKNLLKGITEEDTGKTFALAIGPLVGAALRYENIMYVEAGRLLSQETADRNIRNLKAKINEQREALIEVIGKSAMSQHAQAAIVDMLKVLDQKG